MYHKSVVGEILSSMELQDVILKEERVKLSVSDGTNEGYSTIDRFRFDYATQ